MAADSGRVRKTVGSPLEIAIARRNSCSRSGPRTLSCNESRNVFGVPCFAAKKKQSVP